MPTAAYWKRINSYVNKRIAGRQKAKGYVHTRQLTAGSRRVTEEYLSRATLNMETGCLEYGDKGYTTVSFYGKSVGLHRFVYISLNPDIDVTRLVIRHRCDNPKCINPEHLIHGTHRDNMLDKQRPPCYEDE